MGAQQTLRASTGPRADAPPVRWLPWLVVAFGAILVLDLVSRVPRGLLMVQAPWMLARLLPFVLLVAVSRNRKGATVLAAGLLLGQAVVVALLDPIFLEVGPVPAAKIWVPIAATLLVGGMLVELWSSAGRPDPGECLVGREAAFGVAVALPVTIGLCPLVLAVAFALVYPLFERLLS